MAKRTRWLALLVAVYSAAAGVAGIAQEKSNGPERTTANFGDWILRCERPKDAAKPVCEVAQVIVVQGQQAPIAQIAFGRLPGSDAIHLTLALPVNVTLTAKPRLFSGKDDRSPLEPEWLRCVPGGCMAGMPAGYDVLTRLGGRNDPGSIAFKDAAGRELALPLSFRGLTQAWRALANQ